MPMTPAAKPVRLVVSLLSSLEEPRSRAIQRLADCLGPLVYLSEPLPFTDTDYYTQEMGGPLTRRVAAFNKLVEPHELVRIKGVTDSLEGDLARGGKRTVNLDPGLVSEHSLVLATHKNAPHRIALGPEVYGELTLLYGDGRFKPLPWTYPDYTGKRALQIFFHLRKRYLWQLRNRGRSPFPAEDARPRRKQQGVKPPEK